MINSLIDRRSRTPRIQAQKKGKTVITDGEEFIQEEITYEHDDCNIGDKENVPPKVKMVGSLSKSGRLRSETKTRNTRCRSESRALVTRTRNAGRSKSKAEQISTKPQLQSITTLKSNNSVFFQLGKASRPVKPPSKRREVKPKSEFKKKRIKLSDSSRKCLDKPDNKRRRVGARAKKNKPECECHQQKEENSGDLRNDLNRSVSLSDIFSEEDDTAHDSKSISSADEDDMELIMEGVILSNRYLSKTKRSTPQPPVFRKSPFFHHRHKLSYRIGEYARKIILTCVDSLENASREEQQMRETEHTMRKVIGTLDVLQHESLEIENNENNSPVPTIRYDTLVRADSNVLESPMIDLSVPERRNIFSPQRSTSSCPFDFTRRKSSHRPGLLFSDGRLSPCDNSVSLLDFIDHSEQEVCPPRVIDLFCHSEGNSSSDGDTFHSLDF